MTDIKVTRFIDSDNLRHLCIANEWYTRGDVRAYSHLLGELVSNYNMDNKIDNMLVIAQDIYEHSNIDNDYDLQDNLLNIMYLVDNHCVTTLYR